MILLSMNGGLGNIELAIMRLNIIELDSRWINYPRPKTGIQRKIPLWPETVEAIHQVIANRVSPKDPLHADLLFVSPRGKSYLNSLA